MSGLAEALNKQTSPQVPLANIVAAALGDACSMRPATETANFPVEDIAKKMNGCSERRSRLNSLWFLEQGESS